MVAMSAASHSPSAIEQTDPSLIASSTCEPKVEYDDDDEQGFALSVGELRSVARRQLIGSVAVAFVIAAVAGLMALKSGPNDGRYASAHNFPIVQQPTIVTSTEHFAATVNRAAEVP
jgi:hypothetical protein